MSDTAQVKKLLVVGQIPPPVHGQAVMIQNFVRGDYDRLEVFLIPMSMSLHVGEVGKASLRKLFVAMGIVLRALYLRVRHGVPNLFFPPSGGDWSPMLRDFLILGLIRPFFRRTVFHLHAAGLTDRYHQRPAWVRFLFRLAYGRADLVICVVQSCKPDPAILGAKSIIVIENGVQDIARDFQRALPMPAKKEPVLFFLGTVCEEKGVLDLAAVAGLLRRRGRRFRVVISGPLVSEAFHRKLCRLLEDQGMEGQYEITGTIVGEEKRLRFEQADLFCFPTFYEKELAGLVTAEAMSFQLPIVSTNWHGIPDTVPDGECGILVEPGDIEGFARAVETLLDDPELYAQMAQAGRRRFLQRFTVERYQRDMEEAIATACL